MHALATFRDQIAYDNEEDLSVESRAEKDALSLVLDATALKDELLGFADIVKVQLSVIAALAKQMTNSDETEANMLSTGSKLLQDTMQKLTALSSDVEILRKNVDGTRTDVRAAHIRFV